MQQQPTRSQSIRTVPSVHEPPAPVWVRLASSDRRSNRLSAKTSTERGKFFRQRQKAYETKLVTKVEKLRVEIAQLSFSKRIWSEKALLLRTGHWGSLVELTREMYTMLKHGLESVDPRGAMFNRTREQERTVASMQFKESFLRKVFDPDVVFGGVTGVDFVLDQWWKHTTVFSYFEIELGQVESVSCWDENPIVVIHLKLHVQISRQTFPVMFPFVLSHRREGLMHKVVDRDLTYDCVARLEFSEAGKVVTCGLELNYVSSFMQVLCNARDVADLMLLSVILPDASLADPESLSFVEDEASVII
uniref:BZIP domain-containing protein n=1 Tax=Globisporangium ultimum (strain ATCC 200006 / CBS 805.95 / DAOM BR144) TaxID=431595 RepID=K3X4U7_GLOUD